MTAVTGKKNGLWLAAALCILLAGWLALEGTRVSVPAEDYDQKLEAAARAERCFQAIREWKTAQGLPVGGAADINGTGMIGLDYSSITTTLGNLEAKRTSTNPNMAAVLVDMFHEAGLEAGDDVAINCSGSFPALNIATLCAVEVLELNPILISSFGASTHGANDPELTYQDMEHYLYEQGLISTRSEWFSIGGAWDKGTEMDPAVRDGIVARLKGLGYPLLYEEDFMESVWRRYRLYWEGRDIKCFVNVGGNDASFGDSSVMVHADGGLLTELAEKDDSVGLIQLFLKDHVPVIHLLNIKGLAADYGMPIDPSPMPGVGEGGVYTVDSYCRPLAAATLLAALACIAGYAKSLRKK